MDWKGGRKLRGDVCLLDLVVGQKEKKRNKEGERQCSLLLDAFNALESQSSIWNVINTHQHFGKEENRKIKSSEEFSHLNLVKE